MPRLKRFQILRSTCRSLLASTSGNVSMILGLSLIPLVGMIGIGVDYGVALANKSKLDNAADTAAIAAVATAKAYTADNPTDTNQTENAKAAGRDRAIRAFAVNSGRLPFATVPTPTVTVSRSGQTFSATVSYATTTQNHFGQIFGSPTINMSGSATASAGLPSYLDFYLLIDVSGSMGLPSTPGGMSSLASMNRDGFDDFQQGCMFACHYPGRTGWTLAVSNNIQLRSGAVNSAVCSLLTRAAQPTVPNQYRVGIYPFINKMAPLAGAGLTTNIATLSTIAQCASPNPLAFTNLLDTGDFNGPMGAGGTHFDLVMPQMQSTVAFYGDGSVATKPKPFIFLVTDGMQNYMVYNNGGWFTASQPAAIDPSVCNGLKSAGATISILYIPYLFINFVPNGGINSTESTKVNAISPNLPTPLRACASDGYFYTANTPDDITAAMNSMFTQAVQVTHLEK